MPSATIQYTTAVELSMIAPIADTAAPSSASVPDPVASLPRHPRGQDDPDRVEDGGGEDQQQALTRDVGARRDAPEGQHHAEDGDPERAPRPTPLEGTAEPQREHGHDRRVEVDDQRGEPERHGLEPRVVGGGVGDVEHAEADRPQQRPPREPSQRPSRRRVERQHDPRHPAADGEPPRHERQPVDAGRVDGLREQAARAERDGADDDERDAGGAGPIHVREGIGGRRGARRRRSRRPPDRASTRTLAS